MRTLQDLNSQDTYIKAHDLADGYEKIRTSTVGYPKTQALKTQIADVRAPGFLPPILFAPLRRAAGRIKMKELGSVRKEAYTGSQFKPSRTHKGLANFLPQRVSPAVIPLLHPS